MYFAGVSRENLKKEYRRLAMKMHPDRGGDTKKFQDMKREYEILEAGGNPSKPSSSSTSDTSKASRRYYEERYYNWNGRYDDYFGGDGFPYEEEEAYQKRKDEELARRAAQTEELAKAKAVPITIKINPYHSLLKKFEWKDKNGNAWDITIEPHGREIYLTSKTFGRKIYHYVGKYEWSTDVEVCGNLDIYWDLRKSNTLKVKIDDGRYWGYYEFTNDEYNKETKKLRLYKDRIEHFGNFDLKDFVVSYDINISVPVEFTTWQQFKRKVFKWWKK